jgi:hypothetical protein
MLMESTLSPPEGVMPTLERDSDSGKGAHDGHHAARLVTPRRSHWPRPRVAGGA